MVAMSTQSPPMHLESRHAIVTGLPDRISDERLISHFSGYGKVQKLERRQEGIIVSFMDVRGAQKAQQGIHELDGSKFRIEFYGQASTIRNGAMTSCVTVGGAASPSSAPREGKRRSPSPRVGKDGRATLRSSGGAAMTKRSNRPEAYNRREGRSPDDGATTSSPCPYGLQGVHVDKLPTNHREATVRDAVRDALKKFGKLAYVVLDGEAEDRKALVIFNSVFELDKLQSERHVKVLGQSCRMRLAEPIAVQEAYSQQQAMAVAVATSSRDSDAAVNPPLVDIYAPKASRTLYVGALDNRQSEEFLRNRFKRFGTILDVDVKNADSPQPYAFIQFADIDSAVRAINAHASIGQKKGRPNFGRSMAASKVWVGAIPPSVSPSYVDQKLRGMLEGSTEVNYDPNHHQAIVSFPDNATAKAGLEKITKGTCQLKCEGQEIRLSADFCSDRLFEFFIDRKHEQRKQEQQPVTAVAAPPSPFVQAVPSDPAASSEALLVPPPNPPEMPSYPYSRYDHHRDSRRSPPRRRDVSRTRSRHGSRDRSRDRSRHRKSSRYDYERSRKRDRKDRKSSGSPSSSRSSSSDSSRRSGSSSSRDSSPMSYSRRERGDKRRDDRRDKDRRNRQSSRVRSPAYSSTKWTEKHPPHGHDDHSASNQLEQQAHERAQSGDSGFSEEPRAPLDPPPVPPPLEHPKQQTLHSPPPLDPPAAPGRPPDLTSPVPQPKVQPGPSSSSVPSHGYHGAAVGEHQQPSSRKEREPAHLATPSSSSRPPPQQPHHQELTKRSSVDSMGRHEGYQHHSQQQQQPQHHHGQYPQGQGHHQESHSKPPETPHRPRPEYSGTRPQPHHPQQHRSSSDLMREAVLTTPGVWPWAKFRTGSDVFRVPLEPVPGYDTRDPRKWQPPRREIHLPLSLPRPPFLYHHDFVHDRPRHIDCEQRKRSSGSVAGADSVRRYSNGSQSRVHSFDDHGPHSSGLSKKSPAVDAFSSPCDSHTGDMRRYDRSDSMSQKSHEGDRPSSSMPSRSDSMSTPPQHKASSSSFEERLAQLHAKKRRTLDISLPNLERVSTGTQPSTPVSTPSSADVNFRHNQYASSSRPSALQIQIPPHGSGFTPSQNTPGGSSSRSEHSPSIRKPLQTPQSAPSGRLNPPPGVSSSHPLFPPNVSVPPPTFIPDQQPSPIISAPPPPPQLPTTSSRNDPLLKSPPITPSSAQPWKCATPSASSPSFSISRPNYLPPRDGPPTTPKSSLASKPYMHQKFQDKDKPAPPQRHDSLSALRSPPLPSTSVMNRSQSLSEGQKKVEKVQPKDPGTEYLQHLFNNTAMPTDIRKLPKIEKKAGLSQPSQIAEKHKLEKIGSKESKEHKKSKEHKHKRKEDGTLETKEERAKRKELERLKKEKLAKKEKKEKKHKEDRKKPKDDERREKKLKKKEKEREKEKGAKKKKKKKAKEASSEDDSSSTDSEDELYIKKASRSLHADFDQPVAGQSMYDRVKRRSSAAPKDESKKMALQQLREKNLKAHNKVKLHLPSSSDEESQKKDSEDSSEDSDHDVSMSEEQKPSSSKKGKAIKKFSSSGSDSEDETFSKKPSKRPGEEPTISDEEKRKKPRNNASTSEESEEKPRKVTVDFDHLFGTEHTEKKEKKRKRTTDEARDDPKRFKRHSFGSEASSDAESIRKIAEATKMETDSVKSEEAVEMKSSKSGTPMTSPRISSMKSPTPTPIVVATTLTSVSVDEKPEIKEEPESRRIVTKASLKVFDQPPQQPQQPPPVEVEDTDAQLSPTSFSFTDSDDSTAAPSHILGTRESSPGSSYEWDHEHETLTEEPKVELRLPSTPQPTEETPVFVEAVQIPSTSLEPPRIEYASDEESAKAAMAISVVDDQETEDAVQSIFDDYQEEEPPFPSHDFIRRDSPIAGQNAEDADAIEEEIVSGEFMDDATTFDNTQPQEVLVESDVKSEDVKLEAETAALEAVKLEEPPRQMTPVSAPKLESPERPPVVQPLPSPSLRSPTGSLAGSALASPAPSVVRSTPDLQIPHASPQESKEVITISTEPIATTSSATTQQQATVLMSPTPSQPSTSTAPGPSSVAVSEAAQQAQQAEVMKLLASLQNPSPTFQQGQNVRQALQYLLCLQDPSSQGLNPLQVQQLINQMIQPQPQQVALQQMLIKQLFAQTSQASVSAASGSLNLPTTTPAATVAATTAARGSDTERPSPAMSQSSSSSHAACSTPSTSTPQQQVPVNPLHQNNSNPKPVAYSATAERLHEKLPCVWRGDLQMKSMEAQVQMNLVSGKKEFLTNVFGPIVGTICPQTPRMRINQRMRWEPAHLHAIFKRLEVHGASCICIPFGHNAEDATRNNQVLKSCFVEYFASKQAAGISVLPASEAYPSSQVYVFPPCELTDKYLSEIPNKEIFRRLQSSNTGYMFVAIVPQDPEAAGAQPATGASASIPGQAGPKIAN